MILFNHDVIVGAESNDEMLLIMSSCLHRVPFPGHIHSTITPMKGVKHPMWSLRTARRNDEFLFPVLVNDDRGGPDRVKIRFTPRLAKRPAINIDMSPTVVSVK